ncbi:MAG: hypothetical protein EAZ92_09580 [Candidatus Kapaibacterium sp.]|nr:MAG: hypothetical protein EAZ92_09580 [Candidatus Kapabacteria bacterium]
MQCKFAGTTKLKTIIPQKYQDKNTMKHVLLLFVFFVIIILSLPHQTMLRAQVQPTIEYNLQTLIAEAAKGYVQPLAAGFTMNMNGGWFHEAPPARRFGFMLEVGAVGMAAFVPLDQTFSRTSTYRLTPDQARQTASMVREYTTLPANAQNDIIRAVSQRDFTVQIAGPTAIGSNTENVRIALSASEQARTFSTNVNGRAVNIVLPDNQSYALDIKGLLNPRDYFLNAVPLVAPQLTIGTFMGTRGVVRFVPNVADWVGLGKLGRVSMFGWGIQHNPLTWFFADSTALPLNVSLNFYNQSYRLTDAVQAAGIAYGATASWRFGGSAFAFTPYAGFLMESTTLIVDYKYQPRSATGQVVNDINGQPLQAVPIRFDIPSENVSRIVLGASIHLLVADIGAEVNLGNRYTTVNAHAFVRLGNDAPKD